MCGICGIALIGGVQPGLVGRMNATLWRRGPDDSGEYHEGEIALAMRRLSIIDVGGSRQPIWSSTRRYVGVFNGEIYNYRELRRELERRGIVFHTQGDGEVILNLFADEGLGAFRRLRGMFAVAIWDTQERILFLARDPLGIKPLFYSQREGELIFGSEIKAVLASGRVPRTVDRQALDAFFAYTYIPAPLTIYEAVRKLEPGTCLEWRAGKAQFHRYWYLPDEIETSRPISHGELADRITESVRAHMVSDVPVGAFLSGGLDSSAIVSRMPAETTDPIRAFTVRFPGVSSHLFDETPYARQLQARYGFELLEQDVEPGFLGPLEDGIQAFDEPFADDSLMPTYEICRVASKYLKVCLAGAGGDELFGGYNRYQGLAMHSAAHSWLPSRLIPAITGVLGVSAGLIGRHRRRGDLIQRFADGLARSTDEAYLGYVTSLPWAARRELHVDASLADISPEDTCDLVSRHLTAFEGPDRVKAAMYADTQTYLPEDVLALSDRIGMWHSLEIRVPLADKELLVAAFGLQSKLHVTSRGKKIALKQAVKDWLPPGIVSHPKQGFESPTAAWLRGEGRAAFDELMNETRDGWGEFLQPSAVKHLVEKHMSGNADMAKALFSMTAFATWLKIHAG